MTIIGIDISKWNGNWNAKKAKEAGATFVFIKASQATFSDPQFAANWQKAREAGLLRGAYHYLDYTKPGVEQADYFANLLKDDPGELPPVVDYEQTRTDNNPNAALGFLKGFLDRMIQRKELYEDAVVKRPMIYSGPGFWAAYGEQTNPEYWLQFPLWNAHWITSANPIVPPPWTMWTFWQYTAKGPGETFGSESLAIDMDRFNGTLNELLEFAGVRIPFENLGELYETLDDRVINLEKDVSGLKINSGSPNPDLSAKINGMNDQINNLGGTLATVNTLLTQRITEVEKKVASLGSTPPVIPVTPTPVPGTYAICTAAALNVRSGPGINYQIIAAIQYGTRVKVLARQNGWSQLESPAGWSSDMYLMFEPTTTPQPTPSPTPDPTPTTIYAIVNTSALNVRNGPGVSYSIVGGVTYGQRVKILNRKDGWAQIESPAGWCNESYLSF